MDTDIDFTRIVPRKGSKSDAFEELCCQLARRVAGKSLQSLHGAGGDGGIECYVDTPEGRSGWQAKYVFRVDSLITQAGKSLKTALRIHPDLTRFVLCFPFDLTGPTARRGQSGTEKVDAWKADREKVARASGRQLTIEIWSAFEIRHLLLKHDLSGGLRHFFFGTTLLSDDWFSDHLKRAIATAGPRYTPESNVETDLGRWVAAFGREESWVEAVAAHTRPLRNAEKNMGDILQEPRDERDDRPKWPDDTLDLTRTLIQRMRGALDALSRPLSMTAAEYDGAVTELTDLARELRRIEDKLVHDLEKTHGAGSARSPGWRQWMAEYMASFPAAHLDSVRDLGKYIEDLATWLRSPESILAFQELFVLTGDPGTGKTHGICDAARRRHDVGLRTCIVFGHQFGNQPEPWSRVAQSLGLPVSLGPDRLLGCLNAAGELSGLPLLLCIDAINETKPLSYWGNYASSMWEQVRTWPYLRLCIVCKTTYLDHCLPNHREYPIATHVGFVGIEREACQAYFSHFGLRPPIAPILQPELANPLYLRLVCETLVAAGMDRLPPGWSGGGTAIIRDFLAQKASRFSAEFESVRSGTSTTCLMHIVTEIAASGTAAVPWSTARDLIASEVSNPDAALTWLVGEGLLIQDVSNGNGLAPESVLRPAFERLGDFLVATEILNRIPTKDPGSASRAGGTLHQWLRDTATIRANRGILGELSILLGERSPSVELPDLACDPATLDDLSQIAIRALAFRTPDSLTPVTAGLVRKALGRSDLAYDATDAILGTAWRRSSIDAFWFHRLLARYPMQRRDAFWCAYIHNRFRSGTALKSLIAAVDELPLETVEPDVTERWVTILLWITAAADRRAKDAATRAATALLTSTTSIIRHIVSLFIDVNDDEVRERALLSCYGAMLMTRDQWVVQDVATQIFKKYAEKPANFDNAVIRDHMRCICELSVDLSPTTSKDVIPDAITRQVSSSHWPLQLPGNEDVEAWSEKLRFRPDEFHSDFFKYSMNCLRRWMCGLSKLDMGKWIAQRVARDFAFVGSGCEGYDSLMLQKYGGGRAKPYWAERVAKKYAWIALYQLASRLHDHVEPHLEHWEVGLPRVPLILPEARKLDPTISASKVLPAVAANRWSVPSQFDPDTHTADFETWASDRRAPTLQKLVRTKDPGNRRPILAYLTWEGPERQSGSPTLYRQIWAHLKSYLVPVAELEDAYNSLRGRNLLRGMLPEPAQFLHGFVAEYPWCTLFDVAEEEAGSYDFFQGLPTCPSPAWGEIVSEWQYDSMRPNSTVHVPAKQLLSPDLRWDGKGGFSASGEKAKFVDPSFLTDSPPAVLAETRFFNQRLKAAGLSLLLTLVGEKRLVASDLSAQTGLPWLTFSQVGYLDGTREYFGDLVFFDDFS